MLIRFYYLCFFFVWFIFFFFDKLIYNYFDNVGFSFFFNFFNIINDFYFHHNFNFNLNSYTSLNYTDINYLNLITNINSPGVPTPPTPVDIFSDITTRKIISGYNLKLKNKSGVYGFINKINGKAYIGSSRNL